jgi:hypothetical protein
MCGMLFLSHRPTWAARERTMTCYHRAIQTNIGRALRAHYGEDSFSQPLPDKLRTLLKRLDELQSTESDKTPGQNKPDRRAVF